MRRLVVTLITALISLLALTGAAQAVVVNDAATTAGVAMLPGTRGDLATAGVSVVTAGGTCTDPALSADFILPSSALCFHSGGSVMHGNETFALTWDPGHAYWQTTRGYIEQFLSDVAAGSGTLTSPYAVTGQYTDGGGRAANASLFGGGCIDYGVAGGASCRLGSTNGNGAGHDYPAGGCPVTGSSYGTGPNTACIDDAQIQAELSAIISQAGLAAHTKPGYTPLVVVLPPPGVEVCVDGTGNLCSANSAATAEFCSYHSHLTVAGQDFGYVVQPWTPYTACDEPNLPKLPQAPTPQQVAVDAGLRIVNPLSQGQNAAIVNPDLNAWYANDGSEINDNAPCAMVGYPYDKAIVGTSAQNPYYLQREYNNGGAIAPDPNTYFGCVPGVIFTPMFVAPGAVNAGDVVEFDGSATASTLLVPKANYYWNFGDGTPAAAGPSVVHAYSKGGVFTVKLTVIDRGGDVASLSQTVTVLGAGGTQVTPPPTHGHTALHAHLTLMPQSLNSALHRGVSVAVTANETADGIAMVSISRAAARRAHLKHGRGATVVVGRGTVSGVKAGTVKLHLQLPHGIAAQLGRLHHLTLTVRLTLVAAGGAHVAIDAAGRY